LAARSVEITQGTETRLLVNDRADVSQAAGADGVHLTAQSLEAEIIRRAFGPDFLIGVSTHTLSEALSSRDGGADFIVFGPVFDTPTKRAYGAPLGIESLRQAAQTLAPFPVIALGGITRENAPAVLRAGAGGIAAIQLFSDANKLEEIVAAIPGAGI
jgi:thiamine-phosphate pyrophosphorylase